MGAMPYRLDLAGGWLDQPFVSRYAAGPVITISVDGDDGFNERSGMASSTRKRAMEIWPHGLPADMSPQQAAKILFAYENPPGTTTFSGSQDALGIALPGLNRLDYAGEYWPKRIISNPDSATLDWLEAHVSLVALSPRMDSFDVMKLRRVYGQAVCQLVAAAEECWKAIGERNLSAFGKAMKESFHTQVKMFPAMMTNEVRWAIETHEKSVLGYKLAGAGGGGYFVLVSEKPVKGARRIKIRRANNA